MYRRSVCHNVSTSAHTAAIRNRRIDRTEAVSHSVPAYSTPPIANAIE